MGRNDSYKEALKQKGLKNTKHRNSIMEILSDNDLPVTAEQVFFELKKKDVSINLSTVYRILETLVSKELAVKSSIAGDSKALFELNRMEHKHHIVCIGCKKMFSVDGCPLKEYEKLLQDKTGFDVTGHRLEIYGYCRDCKSKTD